MSSPAFSNWEIPRLFKDITFPYSKELKDIKNQSRPNLEIENTNQSLYSVLKYIRNQLVYSKLKNGKKLLFDRYINDVLGLDLDVDSFYPPENLHKLDKLITELKEQKINESDLFAVLYYIYKDFSLEAAERFVKSGADGHNDDGEGNVTRISQHQYKLINTIYALDRFDVKTSLIYIDSSLKHTTTSEFINTIIRLSNIISYPSPLLNVKELHSPYDINRYIELNSSRDASFSSLSVTQALGVNPYISDIDIHLIYLDAITDTSPRSALEYAFGAKSLIQSSLSFNVILRIVVMKLLIRSQQQQQILSDLYLGKKIVNDEEQFEQIIPFLSHYYLIGFKGLEKEIEESLYQILEGKGLQEETELKTKYPEYFNRFNQSSKQIKKLVKQILIIKQVSKFNTDFKEVHRLEKLII